MKSMLLFCAFIFGYSAAAAKCPNIAGTFVMETSFGHDTTVIRQVSCRKVIFTQLVAVNEKKTIRTKSTYILDGKWRPDKSLEGQKPVKSSAKMTGAGVEIVQRSKSGDPKEEKIVLSLDEDRNLLIQKDIPEVWQRAKKKRR